ncbi:bacterial regulatory helix-turn-helix, lysR family protein [Collimonas arenae]|uniref:Bacterial regulatory helix-turn-helix, lysR family protein n=1 Tax=Collimonas arenae TaxID=279058 RepID=A0A127PPC8_9BURK|nr:LysR family transcriptional regulator [Collimonas arenae]AMO99261.1 bacterial regulatory helix-turn-helix, lysR family protein [Collimonas arenae]AMP09162.1 bacterial regulatory helix-turn-helix, lysR family protein [Collimonas arenae]
MDKLAGMAMFVRVVEIGSFTAAASASGVSPTMVAKHIRTIEQRIGARLLHRTTRRQQLTEVGRLYYERCKRVLSEVDLAEASASELQTSPRGLIRLVAPVSFGSQSLTPVLADYLAAHPEVNVELTLDNRVADLINDGYELGLHIGHIDTVGLVARPLRPYRRILAAAPGYLAQHGQPEHPEQLEAHSCLGLSYWRHHDRWHLVGPDGQLCDVAVKGRFSSNQGSALRNAALHGAGIVLQPEALLADDIAAGRLLPVLPAWSYKPTPMYLIYAQDTRPTAKLRSVIDLLLKRFGLEQ